MTAFLLSQTGFVSLFSIFGVGAVGALWLGKNDATANWWGNLFAIFGSLWGIAIGILSLAGKQTLMYTFVPPLSPLRSR